MEFFGHAESWVLVAFLLFVALVIYLKFPAMLAKMLDERAAKIGSELDDARKLRTEAEALLIEYKKKRADAELEAQAIVAQAKIHADEYAAETRHKLGESIERRTKQAGQKIAQAEAQAIKDVRNAVADIAIAAATRLTADNLKGGKGAALIAESIAAVKSRLN